jgi:hypothetical protein
MSTKHRFVSLLIVGTFTGVNEPTERLDIVPTTPIFLGVVLIISLYIVRD